MRTLKRLAALAALIAAPVSSGCAIVARTVYAQPTRCAALCDTYFRPLSLATDNGHGTCSCYAPLAAGERDLRPTSATIHIESRPLVAAAELGK
jgi:hypothetical protein